MARRKIVAGNWKMNMTPSEAVALVELLKPIVVSEDVDVVFCVPAIDIIPVVKACEGTNIAVGAENMYFEEDVYKRQVQGCVHLGPLSAERSGRRHPGRRRGGRSPPVPGQKRTPMFSIPPDVLQIVPGQL